MQELNRRRLLATSAALTAAPFLPNLEFLGPLSHAVAADPTIRPDQVRLTSDLHELVKLMRTTPSERCVAVFVDQLQAGLSYQELLSALFLASVEHGDPHQVAGVYSAHRLSSAVRTEERLLPIFWALDRICRGFQEEDRPAPTELTGELPPADRATAELHDAMTALDFERAERAIVVIARAQNGRRAMSLLWEYSARRVHGTLGHHPIMAANSYRTLDALGWQHADPVLRYLARAYCGDQADRTYEPNREFARKLAPMLPSDWAFSTPNRGVTLELYDLLRQGHTDASCELVGERLVSGDAQTGAIWDAIHLVAADLLARYRTGGIDIGGYLIHAVTSTNALHFAFDCDSDDRVRLLMLLQAIGGLGDLFVAENMQAGMLRALNILELPHERSRSTDKIADVFEMLPKKTNSQAAEEPDGARDASDLACRRCLGLLQSPSSQREFQAAARSFLCAKATENAHDLKYPVAAFEDAGLVSAEWRPYLLAASVHALHGAASDDAPVLVAAREAVKA